VHGHRIGHVRHGTVPIAQITIALTHVRRASGERRAAMASLPFSAPCNEKSLEGFDKENRDYRPAPEYVSDVAVFHESLPVGQDGQGTDKAVAAETHD
jgi:hypothetical protein